MESLLQISLGDRLRVAGRAIRGVFKQPTPQDLLGVYTGLFPGGPGSPPPRGMAELIKSYADMPWLHAGVGKIASGVASTNRNRSGFCGNCRVKSGMFRERASWDERYLPQ
jgi:hypothetical protein